MSAASIHQSSDWSIQSMEFCQFESRRREVDVVDGHLLLLGGLLAALGSCLLQLPGKELLISRSPSLGTYIGSNVFEMVQN